MRLFKSFRFAWCGLVAAFREELNLKIHGFAAVVVILLGFYIDLKLWEWCAVIFCVASVISLELMNTAIEKLCDLVTQDTHPVIGKIKDIAAAAVLWSSISSLVVAIIIFGKYFF